VEIGLNVVVDRGRGSTTTNHEGLIIMVTCHSKTGQQDHWNRIRREFSLLQRKKDKFHNCDDQIYTLT